MITTPMDVLRQFPVRKTRKQKKAFRDAVGSYARGLGYKTKTEQGAWGIENVVIGDPETARYLVTSAASNTCGVVTVLETASSMPRNLRDRVCFVLFDGWIDGSGFHCRKHQYAAKLQTVLHLDRVEGGDTICFTPSKGLKSDSAMLARLIDLERRCGEKRVRILDRKKPRAMSFPSYIRIRSRNGKKQSVPDYTNVNILRAGLITFIGGAAE